MNTRRVITVLAGVVLVVVGLVGFFTLDGVTADLVCAAAVVAGLGTFRYASRPRPEQIV